MNRLPSFGDYAATHPNQGAEPVNPRFITTTPTIKYTTNDEWLIARGKAPPKKKKKKAVQTPTTPPPVVQPVHVQYPRLSKLILDCDEWHGGECCWGSKRIEDCYNKRANKIKATGSSADWISVATCHHVTVVAGQIADLL